MIDWSGVFHILATPFRDGRRARHRGPPAPGRVRARHRHHRLHHPRHRRRGPPPHRRGAAARGGDGGQGGARARARSRWASRPPARTSRPPSRAWRRSTAPTRSWWRRPPGLKNLDAVAEYYRAVAAATAAAARAAGRAGHHPGDDAGAPSSARLCAEIPQIEAVKLEEAPTLPKITRLRALFGDRVAIFGGLGGVYFFEELSRGADGAMTGFPYPEALRAIRDALRGRPARRGPRALLPLAAADPLREPAGLDARHRGRHPQGDPPPPRLDRARALRAAARARARRGHARRARRDPRRRREPERRAPRSRSTTSGSSTRSSAPPDAPPLVLIMGWGGDHTAWAFQVPALAAEHRVIALDNRGAGQSDVPDAPYTIAGNGRRTWSGLMDALGMRRAAHLRRLDGRHDRAGAGAPAPDARAHAPAALHDRGHRRLRAAS